MSTARDIIQTIKKVPNGHRCMPFLVSLANWAFTQGGLTEKQEVAYKKVLDVLDLKTVCCCFCKRGLDVIYDEDLGDFLCGKCRVIGNCTKKMNK